MKEKWLKRYESMQQEIETCLRGSRAKQDAKAAIECCFNISLKYWSDIQMGIADVQFNSIQDEIDYYKTVKPLFKSQMEYYKTMGRLNFSLQIMTVTSIVSELLQRHSTK